MEAVREEIFSLVDDLEGTRSELRSDLFRKFNTLEPDFNPANLLKRIDKLQLDILSVRESFDRVLERKAGNLELVSGFNEEFKTAVASIQDALSIEIEEMPIFEPGLNRCEEMTENFRKQLQAGKSNVIEDLRVELLPRTSKAIEEITQDEGNEETVEEILVRGGGQFVEVSKEEFDRVPQVLRGRAKLDDVNKIYKYIHKFYRRHGREEIILIPDMMDAGLRVVGATGTGALAVLRDLGIIKQTKQGIKAGRILS